MVADMQEKGMAKKWKGKLTKDNFLILFLVGILLMVIVWPVEKKEESGTSKSGQWDSETAILSRQSEAVQSAVPDRNGNTREDELLSYAASMESALEELLKTMDGVGKVRVMVTLESSCEAVVEKDTNTVREGTTEVDAAGGSRNTTNISESQETIYRNGSDTPYVKKILSPQVSGVVVSAQGGGNAKTVQNITEAIQALFGLEAHKIKIVKMISQ